MIEEILNYVHSFLVLFLLLKILLFLIPKTTFEKYISFLSGVILVIGVLQPLLVVFNLDDNWRNMLYRTTFEKQALEASLNVLKPDDGTEDLYTRQMKTLVEEEIKKQMQFVGITLENIEVDLTKDYQINSIKVVVLEENEEENARLLECLQKEYHLSAAQYEIVYE